MENADAQKGDLQLKEDICPPDLTVQLSADAGVFQHDSSLHTPKQKLVSNEAADQHALLSNSTASSCGSSSDISVKEGFDSSSLSPEFDSEYYCSSPDGHQKSALTGMPMTLQENYLDIGTKLPSKDESTKNSYLDCAPKLIMEDEEYQMVLNSIMDDEHKLLASNQKIQFSEEEMQELKCELGRNELVFKLIVLLKMRLESAINMHKDDFEMDKRKIQELHEQVALLESQILDSDDKIEQLESELEMTREKLEDSEEEVARLKHDCSKVITENTSYLTDQLESTQEELLSLKAKLDSEESHALELQECIMRHKADISDRDQEIRQITAVLEEAQEKFCKQKEHLQFQITQLSKQQALLESRFEELELQNKSLEYKARQCEAEKNEMKSLHEEQEIKWKAETECLNMDINKKGEEVQALVKDCEKLNAEVRRLGAEVMSRNIQIQEKDHLKQLIAESESSIKELTLRVEVLQEEVEKQTLVISDRAEEKREAIRQLCFSLDHYRSGYQELQAYLGRKMNKITAT